MRAQREVIYKQRQEVILEDKSLQLGRLTSKLEQHLQELTKTKKSKQDDQDNA